jgi:hydroxymethylpyrimidine/phosphomethylpyrimidine kinase
MVREDRWPRLPGSYHGSGCTLASAIAAALAIGLPVAEAVREAQEYTWRSLATGFKPGAGQYLPDRLRWAREAHGPRKGAK